MNQIAAIDAWCNPFDERGIRTIFIDNEEVYFMPKPHQRICTGAKRRSNSSRSGGGGGQ